jgi:hypothetical protein
MGQRLDAMSLQKKTHFSGEIFQHLRVPACVWHPSPIRAISKTLLASRTSHEGTIRLKMDVVVVAVVDDFMLSKMRMKLSTERS